MTASVLDYDLYVMLYPYECFSLHYVIRTFFSTFGVIMLV